ncbi:MAG: S8 family serine peptidase [Rhizobiales bacterium]|nr:S8 family serine peptidase [Hyphomicrobiales bacterium]
MHSDQRRFGRLPRFWRGVCRLTLLAAVAVVPLGSLADASPRGGRGMSAKPSFNNRAVRDPGHRVQGVRPSHVNRGTRNVRPSARGSRGSRGEGWSHAAMPPRGAWHPPRGPRRTRDPRGPRILGAVIPGIIGVIGTIVTQPAHSDPEHWAPPPRPRRQPAANRRPPRQQGPTRTTRRPSGAPPAGEQRLVPDELVIQLPPGTSEQVVAQLAARHQLIRLESQTFQLTGESMFRWRIPDQRSMSAVIRALERDAGVRTAQPNYLFVLQQETAGPGKGDPAQYAIGKLHLPQAHTLAQGDKVLIGVIDSGIDVSHPELAGMIAESYDALPGEGPDSHGTAIAGTIVARSRLLGVAPASRILAAQAFGTTAATAAATTFNILKSIDWAAKNGARVINMSFAGPRDPAIERELAAAYKRNVVLIAAAGNAGPKSPPLYPAADRNVIAVAATDSQDRLFDRSNRGGHITVAAPGVDIIAPAPRGAYQIISGTSIAAAYISGLAALLIERSPNLSPSQIRGIVQTTARDLGRRGRDPEYGAGLPDAYRALKSITPRTADSVTSSRR